MPAEKRCFRGYIYRDTNNCFSEIVCDMSNIFFKEAVDGLKSGIFPDDDKALKVIMLFGIHLLSDSNSRNKFLKLFNIFFLQCYTLCVAEMGGVVSDCEVI